MGTNLRGGIDLGGTKVQAVIVDESNEVLGQARLPTPTSGGPDDVIAQLVKALTESADAAKVATKDLVGVGLGSPGTSDAEHGTIANARNLPNWIDPVPVEQLLGDAFGTRVAIGNDVDVATNAEFELGAAKDYQSLLGVFWGTGVGGGLVLKGERWLGRGAAGEIGHMVIVRDGRKCPCGRRGCMEAYAGRAALEARARHLHDDKGRKTHLFKIAKERGRDRLTSGIWARAYEAEDDLAVELLDEAIDALGAGVASAVNLLDPECVVIGGGLGVRFGEPWVERIKAAMAPHLFNDTRPPAIKLAGLGDLGGALGAALLVA